LKESKQMQDLELQDKTKTAEFKDRDSGREVQDSSSINLVVNPVAEIFIPSGKNF